MNIFGPHLELHQLADYAEGRLQPDEQPPLETHLAGCSQCFSQVRELKRLIGLMRTDTAQDAPEYVIQRAIQLLQTRNVPAFTSSVFRRLIQAVLQFDSMGLAPGFGLRSGKPGVRQMLFRAGANEIDLRIEPKDQAWIVSGQVFGKDIANGRVLLQGANDKSETALNELSEFVLPPVHPGTYRLLLNLEHVDVEIDEIRIGA